MKPSFLVFLSGGILLLLSCGSSSAPKDGGTKDGGSDDSSADGALDGVNPARFEGCVPSCLAELFASCLVPAGSCTRQVVSSEETTSCYQSGVVLDYLAASISNPTADVYTGSGFCYRAAAHVGESPDYALQQIVYVDSLGSMVATILIDSTDPNHRKGTISCGLTMTDEQPFDFDNAACSFLKTNGVAYDDPTVQCSVSDAGTCHVPATQ